MQRSINAYNINTLEEHTSVTKKAVVIMETETAELEVTEIFHFTYSLTLF